MLILYILTLLKSGQVSAQLNPRKAQNNYSKPVALNLVWIRATDEKPTKAKRLFYRKIHIHSMLQPCHVSKKKKKRKGRKFFKSKILNTKPIL